MSYTTSPNRPGPTRRFAAWALISQVCVVGQLVGSLLLAPDHASVPVAWAWAVLPAVALGEAWARGRSAAVVALVGASLFASTGSPAAALALTAAGGGPLARALAARLPSALDAEWRSRRIRTALFVSVTLLALVRGTLLAAFMTDPGRTWAAAVPALGEGGGHQCLAAYIYAAELNARGVADVYDPRLYPSPIEPGRPTDGPGVVGANSVDPHSAAHGASPGFGPAARIPVESAVDGLAAALEDAFLYPPPFLLLPHFALLLSGDFDRIRAGVFAVNSLAFLACFLALAGWIGGPLGLRVGLLLPLVWITLPVQLDLQFGQFHLLAIGMSLVALVAFERGHPLLGGALLSLATVGKVFPGILVLWLAFRREWRALAWTLAGCMAWTGLALAVIGGGTFEAFFVEQVPRLASGELAPGFQRSPDVIWMNVALASLPFKLATFGWIDQPWPLSRVLGWSLRGAVVWLAFRAARRVPDQRFALALTWMALLVLAALQGPFLPTLYGYAGPLWLMCLMIPLAKPGRGRVAWIVVALLSLMPTPPVVPVHVAALRSTIGALLSLGLAVGALVLAQRSGEPSDRTSPG